MKKVPPRPAWPAPGVSLREHLGLPGRAADAFYALGFNSLAAGQIRRAEKFFFLQCMVQPECAHGFVAYGLCLARRDQLNLAELMFSVAARVEPQWAVSWFHLAAVRMSQGRADEARPALRRFFKLRDDDVPAQLRADAERMRRFLDDRNAA